MFATRYGQEACLDWVIGAGANVQATDNYRSDAAMSILNWGKKEGVGSLIAAGVDLGPRVGGGRAGTPPPHSRSSSPAGLTIHRFCWRAVQGPALGEV